MSRWILAVILGGFLVISHQAHGQLIWWNYRTQTFDIRESAPTTDEEAVDYIHQWPEAQRLYRVYREQGFSVLDAMAKVLRAVLDAHEKRVIEEQGQ